MSHAITVEATRLAAPFYHSAGRSDKIITGALPLECAITEPLPLEHAAATEGAAIWPDMAELEASLARPTAQAAALHIMDLMDLEL